MSRLNPLDLRVESFEVLSASVGVPADTQQLECNSPLCMYSEQRTCPEKCPAAVEDGVEAQVRG